MTMPSEGASPDQPTATPAPAAECPGELRGTAALITGGGSGLGLACARALLAEGAHVTLMGRRTAVLRQARHELQAADRHGAGVTTHSGDVTNESHLASAVRAAASPRGRLDIVVCAAGSGAGGGPIAAIDLDEWNRCLGTNLTGAMLTMKHAIPLMGEGGSIVALSSIAGVLTHRYMTAYAVGKAGLEMLVRNVADEVGDAGIRVNAVRPGLVPTALSEPLHSNPGVVDDYLEQMPLGRLGTPEEVAETVLFLAGPRSSWTTGQVFAVDGGHTLRRGPDLRRRTR